MAEVLVLGSTGFIGSAVLSRLERGYNGVAGWSRSTNSHVNLFDLQSTRLCLEWEQPKYIFNCAAHVGSMKYISDHFAEIFHDNTLMASNLYRAASEVCDNQVMIINPLSNCSYPGNSDIQREREWLSGEPHPSVYPYAHAKRFLYELSVCYQRKIVSTNLILPNTFGPGDHTDPAKTHALSGLIQRMIEAKRLNAPLFKVWGTGAPIREWGYISDMADLLTHAMDHNIRRIVPLNLAQARGWSIARSAREVAEAVGYVGDLVFDTNPRYDGDPKKILDDTEFRKFFPTYEFTDHTEAIRRTVHYYESVL